MIIFLMPKAQLLCTLVPNQTLQTVSGEAEKDNSITLPGKGGTQWANALKPCVPTWGRQ